MWRRALVAVILLALTAALLVASSNSRVNDISIADLEIAPVVIDTRQSKDQAAQIQRLQEDAKYAMRSLMAKHMQATISVKNEMKVIEGKPNGIFPSE